MAKTDNRPTDPMAMTAENVIAEFAISRKTLWRWQHAGLPHYRLGKRLLRFRRDDLEQWFAAQRVQTESAA
jgi:excisionase family DNA binding protein